MQEPTRNDWSLLIFNNSNILKNRSNIAASILQNPAILEQAYEAAQHSEGVGQKELDIYLDSITAKMQNLTNELQRLSTVTINSDWLKGFIDLGTGAVKVITKLADKLGGINMIISTILGTMMGFSGHGRHKSGYAKTQNAS